MGSHYGIFYNDKKEELMGSDGLFVCDGRYSMMGIKTAATKQAKSFDKNFPHKKITYLRLIQRDTLRNRTPTYLTGFIKLR